MSALLETAVGRYTANGWRVVSLDDIRAVVERTAPMGCLRLLLIICTFPIGLIFIWAGRDKQTMILSVGQDGGLVETGAHGSRNKGDVNRRMRYITLAVILAMMVVLSSYCAYAGSHIGG